MTTQRRYSIEFKRQVVQEYQAGETLHGLAEASWHQPQSDPHLGCQGGGRRVRRRPRGSGFLQEYEARISALERLVGKLALENEFLKGASRHNRPPISATTSVVAGPVVSSVAEGCRLMELARSTYYDEPQGQPVEEARLVERIKHICAEWPVYPAIGA